MFFLAGFGLEILTVIGCALAVFVASLCLWITIDLDALVTTQQQSYWSGIATVDGFIDFKTAQMFAGLTRILAVFMVIILAGEAAIVVYAHFRIHKFAEETLNLLTAHCTDIS